MRVIVKIDVDTYRGTKDGVLPLCELFRKYKIPALFLFSFGPDNTGKALRRIFRKGFLQKCFRSNVAGNYGLKTLMYGTLLPAPIIYKKCKDVMKAVPHYGCEVGIHSWDHFKWQDYLFDMTFEETENEFTKAKEAFRNTYGYDAICCGAAGWQCSGDYLRIQDDNGLLFGSDTRGSFPFFPKMGDKVFRTLQIPSTLETLDELLGIMTLDDVAERMVEKICSSSRIQVMTIHSELEGMAYFSWFEKLVETLIEKNVEFVSASETAKLLLENPKDVPICEVELQEFLGRSGKLSVQVVD